MTFHDSLPGHLSRDSTGWKTPSNQTKVFGSQNFQQFKKNFNFSLASQGKMNVNVIKDNTIASNAMLRSQINNFFNETKHKKTPSVNYKDYSKIESNWPLKGSQKKLETQGDGFLQGAERRLKTNSIDSNGFGSQGKEGL